ncbi:hypothetical protein [Pseudoalteromonas sp. SWN166]|uniref:hypothetical protein n=1 Tax=Pseudoalteromonas sp. SWN166 TaxID=2792061 RepID=UPI0018CCF51D|nr:hypothetical protein [Pseudoalteromonas sp. SWN166]MBH0039693.1 hypothetical protein [Pseudoalteromonas sp. SWN166]
MSTNDILLEIESTIDEIIEDAENLRNKVESTTNYARYENDKVVHSYDNYVPLDNQPFGEELIRTDGIVQSIDEMIIEVDQMRCEEDVNKVIKLIQNTEKAITEHDDTFSDCFSDAFIEQATKEVSDDWNPLGAEDCEDEDEDEDDLV